MKLLIFKSITLVILILLGLVKSGKNNEKESLELTIKNLLSEKKMLESELENERNKVKSLSELMTKECKSKNLKDEKLNRKMKDLFSSFAEMKAESTLKTQTKTDPVFKSIINFALPREVSYVALPGEKSNKMYAHLKVCPPGCIVGGP